MARGKSKFNSTFAILVEDFNDKSKFTMLKGGFKNTSEADLFIQKYAAEKGNPLPRMVIVNVKKGIEPKVKVVLEEQGGADFLGVKPGEEEEENDGGEAIEAAEAAPEPLYVEPAGSDPTPASNESKMPTSEASGQPQTPTVITGLSTSSSQKSPQSLSPESPFPPRW